MIRMCVICVMLAGLAGCRGRPGTNPELASAHEVLKTGLEAWKNGGTPASLKAGATPVQFSDKDWEAGAKLRDYRIMKFGGEDDSEIVYSVNLKMEVGGKAVDRQLSYRVTLAPNRSVARY